MATKKNLQVIPGIGPAMEKDLTDLGISRVEDLRGKNAEEMYERLCSLRGMHIDRCVLYVFRCAVHYAENPDPDPALLTWWNWKDHA